MTSTKKTRNTRGKHEGKSKLKKQGRKARGESKGEKTRGNNGGKHNEIKAGEIKTRKNKYNCCYYRYYIVTITTAFHAGFT